MKKIEVVKWKEKVNGEVIETSTVSLLSILISRKSNSPEGMPKGMDNFRLMSRIGRAFDKVGKGSVLELEEGDYGFLKTAVENEVPSEWGMNKDIMKAVEGFLKAGGE